MNREIFEKILQELEITIVRENILGYIDLRLPNKLIFKDAFPLLKAKNMFESIDINSYGELHMPVPPTPNDPEYSNQWHISHVNADLFWENFTTGSSSVKVAVLGEGVDPDHQDLNIWYNFGYDFEANPNDNDPSPCPACTLNHHETVMSGLIAAKTNNGTAVSGIAGGWNGDASTIIAVKTGENGQEDTEAIDDGIIYAANNGAKVINMSFGLLSSHSAIDAAIQYAFYQKGCILVASAGNDSYKATQLYYPGRHPQVIGIGGINEQDENNNQWTTGSDMFIVAPATNITSTTLTSPGDLDATDTYSDGGTSSAAAITSGAAALLYSQYPSLTNHDIIKLLKEGANSLSGGAHSNTYGWGLLDVNSSGQLYDYDEYLRPQNVTLTGSTGQSPTISWTNHPNSSANEFFIYRANSTEGEYRLNHIGTVQEDGSPSYSFTDNEVTIANKGASIIYYYRVKGVTGSFESLFSEEVSCWSNTASKRGYKSDPSSDVYQYKITQNMPNPFNPTTNIEFSIKESGHVKLYVFDILGEQIKVLEDGQLEQGRHTYIFDGSQLPSGVYFYVFQYADKIKINKMMLLK